MHQQTKGEADIRSLPNIVTGTEVAPRCLRSISIYVHVPIMSMDNGKMHILPVHVCSHNVIFDSPKYHKILGDLTFWRKPGNLDKKRTRTYLWGRYSSQGQRYRTAAFGFTPCPILSCPWRMDGRASGFDGHRFGRCLKLIHPSIPGQEDLGGAPLDGREIRLKPSPQFHWADRPIYSFASGPPPSMASGRPFLIRDGQSRHLETDGRRGVRPCGKAGGWMAYGQKSA